MINILIFFNNVSLLHENLNRRYIGLHLRHDAVFAVVAFGEVGEWAGGHIYWLVKSKIKSRKQQINVRDLLNQ